MCYLNAFREFFDFATVIPIANPDTAINIIRILISDESPVGTTSTELSGTSSLSSVSLLISSLPLLMSLSGTSITSPVTPL